MEIDMPKADYASAPMHASFFGNFKVSAVKSEFSLPVDPEKKAKKVGHKWPRPKVTPIPQNDSEGAEIQKSLSGVWKFTMTAPKEYWKVQTDDSAWDDVPVPGELMALGYEILRDTEYVYKKKLQIPKRWKDRRIVLKFGMVYEYCKIWIDGSFVRDHRGAFTSFECDITSFVEAGKEAELTVMCMHTHDALADWGSDALAIVPGYAGIIDDVKMVSMPKKHISRLNYEVDFDEAYANAVLKVTAEVSEEVRDGAKLKIRLLDPSGKEVNLRNAEVDIDPTKMEQVLLIHVETPMKWDAEHPNLYRMIAELQTSDTEFVEYEMNVGFRKVERRKNDLYVNGMKTKLRGAGLYSHDPILGKVFSREKLERIIQAAKWANINYIRSCSYPERSDLYDLCDQYGIYVEECAAANFQRGTWDSQHDAKYRPSSNLPAYTEYYLNQFSEMVERDRNHPSVIIWEYGNESDWGINFQAQLDYLMAYEPTRMTAGTWSNEYTSLASYHYPQYDEIIPNAALYDEYAHVATHDMKTLRRDPAIRNAWGESIRRGWEAIYDSEGVVGCAIFALDDYVILRPQGVYASSYGQWGLIDTWLRDKPELWLTRKGYSPVKLPDKQVRKPAEGMALTVPVKNRYNHTNLQELTFVWSVGEEKGQMQGPCVAPSHNGALILPARGWKDGELLKIEVYEKDSRRIDEYELCVGTEEINRGFVQETDKLVCLEDYDDAVIVRGQDFEVRFSKESGLIESGTYQGEKLIESGPYLNFHGAYYKPSVFQNDRHGAFSIMPSGFRCSEINAKLVDKKALISIKGVYPGSKHYDMWQFEYGYEPIRIKYEISIDGSGRLQTDYEIENPPKEFIFEVGVSYILSDDVDRLVWDKEAVYSAYPEDHIGRPRGCANRYRGFGKEQYRCSPEWSWSKDEADYVLYGHDDEGGHGTRDFLASREQIYFASAILAQKEQRVRVESDGKNISVRVCPARDEDKDLPKGIKLTMNNGLYYDLGNGSSAIVKSGDGYLGNYTYPEIKLEDNYHGKVVMRLTDNDRYSTK